MDDTTTWDDEPTLEEEGELLLIAIGAAQDRVAETAAALTARIEAGSFVQADYKQVWEIWLGLCRAMGEPVGMVPVMKDAPREPQEGISEG